MQNLITFLLGSLILSVSPLHAQNWPQWRGPNFDGTTSLEGSASSPALPTKFSQTEKLKWTAPMPGPAAATPIVWGDNVFVSSTDAQAKTLVAMCFDRKTGKLLWQEQTGNAFAQDNKSNYAASSPVTDGKIVIFFYGNGDLAAFTPAGKKVWARNVQTDYGHFAFLWTFSSSPLLYDGRLYLQVLQRNEAVSGHGRKDGPNDSYLLALDPTTGKELWREIRPSDARAESREAFTSPVPYTYQGRSEILVVGGDDLTGHDPVTGKELWRWGTWNPTRIGHWRLVPSPVAGAGIVVVCAPKGAPVYGIKAGGKGKLDDSHIAWKSAERSIVTSDVSTPLFFQDHFFILNSDKRTLAKLEPATGQVVWSGELGSRAKIEASPTAADGKIYVMNHRGDVFVLSAGDEFKVLHTVQLGDSSDTDLRSSIPIAQGSLFVRTGKSLFCFAD